MKIALAPRYRLWMLALLPSTLGLGSAVLWLRSLNWPLDLDEEGLTLRNLRQVNWHSITKIGVSRGYLDGHVSEIRVHYDGGVSKIPAHALKDGQMVIGTILAMFEQTDRARAHRAAPSVAEVPRRDVTKLTQGFGMLANTWGSLPPRPPRMPEFMERRT
jgi:hypothetical protein